MASNPAVETKRRFVSLTSAWVVFSCGDQRFGVPVEDVLEIVPKRARTRIPGCGPAVAGLVNVRGRIITLLDFGAALSLDPAAEAPEHQMLIVESGERHVALAVEEVLGLAAGISASAEAAVRDATGDRLPIPGAALQALDIDQDDLAGIGVWGEQPFLAMDPNRIVRQLLD